MSRSCWPRLNLRAAIGKHTKKKAAFDTLDSVIMTPCIDFSPVRIPVFACQVEDGKSVHKYICRF